MKQIFIADATVAKVKEQCPWAAVITLVEGGCMCFESWDDFTVWNNQN